MEHPLWIRHRTRAPFQVPDALLQLYTTFRAHFPGGSESSVCLQCAGPRFDPWVGKIPWRRKWQPTSVLLPGKSHGWRSLVGYSLWGRKESDMTERLHFSLTGLGHKRGSSDHFSSGERKVLENLLGKWLDFGLSPKVLEAFAVLTVGWEGSRGRSPKSQGPKAWNNPAPWGPGRAGLGWMPSPGESPLLNNSLITEGKGQVAIDFCLHLLGQSVVT